MSPISSPVRAVQTPRYWQASITDSQLICDAYVMEIVWAAMALYWNQPDRKDDRSSVRSLSRRLAGRVTPK